jgi:hypothetical protein
MKQRKKKPIFLKKLKVRTIKNLAGRAYTLRIGDDFFLKTVFTSIKNYYLENLQTQKNIFFQKYLIIFKIQIKLN